MLKEVFYDRQTKEKKILTSNTSPYFSPDGASIHHTSTSLPQTLSNLRTYVLHRLYSPLAPSTSRFPFAARAEILDRPTLLVPAGWDSWGKITAVKDGFEPAHIGQTWELAVRRHRKEILGDDEREGEEDENVDDLRDLWEEVVPFVDGGVEVCPPSRASCLLSPCSQCWFTDGSPDVARGRIGLRRASQRRRRTRRSSRGTTTCSRRSWPRTPGHPSADLWLVRVPEEGWTAIGW